MKALRSYPGVLTLIIVAAALMLNGLVDYLNYELASPSILGSVSALVAAGVLVVVYEIKRARENRRTLANNKL